MTKEEKIISENKRSGRIRQAALMSLCFVALELYFHWSEGMEFTARFLYPVLFSLPLGVLLASLYGMLPRWADLLLSGLTLLLATVWTGVQICYASVFRSYMDFSKIFMGGDVAANFGGEMQDAIVSNMPKILLLLVFWLTACLWLAVIDSETRGRDDFKQGLIGILTAGLLHGLCIGALMLAGAGAYSPWGMYNQYPRVLDNNIQNFGVLTSLRLEWKDMLLGTDGADMPAFREEDMSALLQKDPVIQETSKETSESDGEITGDSVFTEETRSVAGEMTESTEPATPPELVFYPQQMDIDFEKLLAEETDEEIRGLHQYIQNTSGSYTNAYTGMFEGYNLIMICAESFSSYMIDEELTPTLYKMANNGFVFENFYGTFKAVTTNGEYAFCTGLMPNTSGTKAEQKENSTFMLSSDKYLPYCMGNVFRSLGARTYFYHSNVRSFYDRITTHPNMGYDVCRFLDGSFVDGELRKKEKLTFTTGTKRPNSDEETLLQTLEEYLGNRDENGNVKQFHAYYMTYSGHHPYYDVTEADRIKSPMVYENREIVDPLNCSPGVKAYLAANLEVENMLRELLAALEESGCLDNTVIVLTSDHYPYGLSTGQFADLAALTGKEIEKDFGMYRNSFICYNAGMTEPVVVKEPCCTVDIIPTLLNLFGIDYDSRLLAGTDVLDPQVFHVAMLYNQSFITDRIRYNTTKGEITYLVEESLVPAEYVDACIRYVQNKFDVSLQIITKDYYRVLEEYLR